MVPWKICCQTLLMMTLGSSSLTKITQILKGNACPSSSVGMVYLAPTTTALIPFHLKQYWQEVVKNKWFATFEDFVSHCLMLGKPIHILFLPIEQGGLGMHPMSLYMDCLHVVDLGVAMQVCGNILHLLCYDVLPRTHAANMFFLCGKRLISYTVIETPRHNFHTWTWEASVAQQRPILISLCSMEKVVKSNIWYLYLLRSGDRTWGLAIGMIGMWRKCLITLFSFIIA